MLLIFLIVLFLLIAIIVPNFLKDVTPTERRDGQSFVIVRWGIRVVCIAAAFVCFLATSCFIVDSDKTAHLNRVYFGNEMATGRIIAGPDQKGPQAKIYGPGFHLVPFIRVTHDIDEKPIVSIPEGSYGYVVAKDGSPMPPDQYLAPEWNSASDMIDAMKFMGYDSESENSMGVKGPQLTVLPPGDYRINRYLFDVFGKKATDVPIGHVAVVKSNVGKHYNGPAILPAGVENTTLSVPIVPKGYKGVWKDALTPDRYYLNTEAYDITLIPTQIQTWKYIGGYKRRYIDLKLNSEGNIEQTTWSEDIPVPKDAADRAVLLKVENWDVFQDARIQVQVTPENAPFVVAAAGGIEQIEDKIMTPTFRSVLRNEVAKNVEEEYTDKDGKLNSRIRPRQVMDLFFKREGLETAVEAKLRPEGAKYGLTVMEARFGDPSTPPELLLPGKRKQLAESLIATYKQEKLAQSERVEMEKERAKADQQATLMESEIGIKVADNNALAREKEGLGEKKYMEAVAKGQEAQANVLGKEQAARIAYGQMVLDAAIKEPGIVKFPTTMVMSGGGSSLEGAAAILGASNLGMGMGLDKTGPSK